MDAFSTYSSQNPLPLAMGDSSPSQGASDSSNPASRGTSISIPGPTLDTNRVTVPSACVACRSKHLKCDGLSPCSRCSSNSFECVYVKSRRGFKGPRKKDKENVSPSTDSCDLLRRPGQAASVNGSTFSNGLATPPDHRRLSHPHVTGDGSFSLHGQDLGALGAIQFNPDFPPSDLPERCFEAYYYYFYPSHPFLLPKSHFLKLRQQKSMHHIDAAIRFVGSLYVPQAPTELYAQEAERAIYQIGAARDAFRVQAMLITAIGLDGNLEREKALQILTEAENLAMELGMHTRDFSLMNGAEQKVLEESWRRTWWELFIIDGMIAAVHQQSSFRLSEVVSDVPLPCEENEYASGHIPASHSLQELDDDCFTADDFTFSSFAYRITAMRNTGRVMKLGDLRFVDEATVDRADAYLVNWKMHLPATKKTFITNDRKVDEMLFQAHMIVEATTILLHRDHSQLDFSPAKDITSCAPYHASSPGEQYNTHAAKMIQSAQNVSRLISLPTEITKHSMFFTCVITLASIVHLSVWSVMMPLIQDTDIKEQLKLNIGAMKDLWRVWPSAGKAFGEVKGVAQDIYTAKKQAAQVGMWDHFTPDEIIRNMIEDDRIMEEFQEPQSDTQLALRV
ncbi:hypothetical protein BP5796_08111 [Coleophoma crateriformis]|uniref:Zn(2)-C6 fungal-type domain-containing protein n=1 Tax=Coleophoma crateriformis TaxID=565419 RepID=A0A3D8RDF0_9HELO|nr:hypothetical protein BP5796_08111 [Coleophoma crateriformis]